jgi:hypothetical protein
MNKIFSTIIALGVSALCFGASASDFDKDFTDCTLRLDYQLSADTAASHVSLSQLKRIDGWAGRRHRLTDAMPPSRATFTMTDAASGDTLYVCTFSSLFLEWLDTDEAHTTPRSFESTVLAPMPQRPAVGHVTLLNGRLEPIAQMSHPINPADVLIRPVDSHYPVQNIHIGGAADRAIDVVFLPEGYTADELPDFFAHCKEAVDAILAHEPFASMSERFNFRAVMAPGSDSGVSVPRLGDWKHTQFNSHFSTFYSDRYLTSPNVFTINDVAASAPYEHIIVLANTTEYGGGGILNDYTLTAAGHKLFRPVVVHEFGHSFGGLADEYFYDGDVMEDTYPTDIEPLEPNVTTQRRFIGKWENLVASGDASLVEGGAYSSKGVWRAAEDCRMRTNTAPSFCPACRQALTRLINFYTAD